MNPLDFHAADLARLQAAGRYRQLTLAMGRDFSSNDYLGLCAGDALRTAAAQALARGVALGSGGSRLLRGHGPEHAALEQRAAQHFGAGAALFMGSGYAANSAILSTLPQPGDLIVYDALVHASAHEGMRLARAPARPFAHNDAGAAADVIRGWRAEGGRGTPWLVFETLYSMDGDRAPVADFAALARHTDAMLVCDEAHAAGACGPGGRGLAADLLGQDNAIHLVTCGKALGCEGALILCAPVVRDFLVNRARAFVFSTAPSPLMAAVAHAAIGCIAAGDALRAALRDRVAHAAAALAPLGVPISGSHIQPIVLGEDRTAVAAARTLQARGFDVRAIRPPTVPAGTARLRVSLTLNTDREDIDALAAALREIA